MFGVDRLWMKVVLFVTLAVVGPRVVTFVRFMGYHNMVYNHAPGPCQYVKGIENGSEDIQIVFGSLALITTGIRFFDGYYSTDPFWKDRKGDLKIFDFDRPDEGAKSVEIQGNFNKDTLNPHGLNVWNDKDSGRIFVFVVNHLPEQKETIERFEFFPKTRVLNYLETIHGHEHMRYTNDLVAVAPESFYFTNFLYYSGEWLSHLEFNCVMRWGSVVYYNGVTKSTKVVADDLYLPNGINTSPDGKILYVALHGERALQAYAINEDYTLTQLQKLDIYVSPDNLDIQGQYVLAATFPKFYRFSDYVATHFTAACPSQVLKINIEEHGRLGNITEVYADDGKTFSGATVAVHYEGKQLLIGSVGGKAQYCEVTIADLL